MAATLPDLTAATKIDPNGRITVDSATKVSYAGLTRAETALLYESYGSAFFKNPFKHEFDAEVLSGANSSAAFPWALQNDLTDFYTIEASGLDALGVMSYIVSGQTRMYLREFVAGGGGRIAYCTPYAHGQRWFSVEYNPSIGSFGRLFLRIYTDANRATLQEELYLDLRKLPSFQYYVSMNTYNSGLANAQTGYMQNPRFLRMSGGIVGASTVKSNTIRGVNEWT